MRAKVFPKGKHYQSKKYAFLYHQKLLIEQTFSYLKCDIKNNVLVCIGWLQPQDCKDRYKVKIEYVVGYEPKTTILKPFILPSKHIHMYKDHSVCLHYPPDMRWNEKIKICEYTIPWVSEWIIFYEIYQITGKWEGRESPVHIRDRDKNIGVDIND